MGLSILPVLIYIQTHLDGDLSLESVAARAGRSPFHFHRVFRSETGETLKQYTQRIRLERAALRLGLHETTVLDTALEVGFGSHETFTRAFRRRFGIPPREVLQNGIEAVRSTSPRDTSRAPLDPEMGYELSASKLITLKRMHLASIRHLGPYEEVDGSVWEELKRWADRRGLRGPRALLGIGHDAPSITAAEKLRFDAAIRVEHPFRGTGNVASQQLPEGRFVVTTHVGHYATLAAAYGRLVQRIGRMRNIRFAGLPVIEMYHETTINVDFCLNHTDLYLPVVPDADRVALTHSAAP